MDRKPKIILVDDHLPFRDGLKSILTIENIADVIGEASNGAEFIEILPQLEPDLVIMDIDMPRMNGIEATKKALEILPNLKIIVFTMFGDEEYFQKMNSLGIKAFMLKSSGIIELEKVIKDVMIGRNNLSEDTSGKADKKDTNRDKNETHTDFGLFIISEVPNQNQKI